MSDKKKCGDIPLISIIVPIYKVEKYLEKCVNSIISQTYRNIEIILVDDGSPDNCGKLADNLAKMDSRIKVIHKKKWRSFISQKCRNRCSARRLYWFR